MNTENVDDQADAVKLPTERTSFIRRHISSRHDEASAVNTVAEGRRATNALLIGRMFLRRYGWLLCALLGLLISYLLVWQRGLYMDDYYLKNVVFDPVAQMTTPMSGRPMDWLPARSLHYLVTFSLIELVPRYEFFVRLVVALFVGLNALLLGGLVYRLIGSRLAAVIGGWLFLAPIFAAEAVLWIAACAYVFSATFALLFLHLSLSVQSQQKRIGTFIVGGALAFTLMLLFIEAYITTIGLALLLSLAVAAHKRQTVYVTVKRALLYLLLPGLTLVFFSFLYRRSPLLANRGGLDLNLYNLIERSASFIQAMFWMTVSPEWGGSLLKETLISGFNVILSSTSGGLLLGGAVLLFLLTILTWRNGEREFEAPYAVGLVLFFTGLIWLLVAMLFPGVVGKAQILEYRMLYYPTAGLSLSVAALIWMATKYLRSRQLWGKVFLSLASLALLGSSITMLGYTRLFARRYATDQRQVSVVAKTIASETLPAGAYLVPYKFDQDSGAGGTTGSKLLSGVFEARWSAQNALNAAYRRNDLQAITANRWSDWRFKYDAQGLPNNRLHIQGTQVPIDKTLLVAYLDGKALPVQKLLISMNDGTEQTVIFPLASNLAAQGVPTVNTLSVLNEPNG